MLCVNLRVNGRRGALPIGLGGRCLAERERADSERSGGHKRNSAQVGDELPYDLQTNRTQTLAPHAEDVLPLSVSTPS